MSAFSVYIAYPLADGTYSDYVEVTDDVIDSSLGSIRQALEANEFDVGKITFGNIDLEFRNEHSRYSNAGATASKFPYKRDETLVKITWDINTRPAFCGSSPCGYTFLSFPQTIFEGLLEDGSTEFDVDSQIITFRFLSLDSIINKADTPYSSLLVSDTAETLLYKILNQPRITTFFDVDSANISVSNNFVPDVITSLDNTSCLESIQEILKLANAIMFVKDRVIYIRTRVADPTLSYTFYGPAADKGIENVLSISSYTTGLNRTFNYLKWEGTSLNAFFADSVALYGRRVKEIGSDLITNSTKRLAVLTSYLTEFGFPVIELELKVKLTTEIAQLSFLNKIIIDYPYDVLIAKDEIVARYGQGIYGVSKYAKTINSLFISSSKEWKILNITIDPKNDVVKYKLRGVN